MSITEDSSVADVRRRIDEIEKILFAPCAYSQSHILRRADHANGSGITADVRRIAPERESGAGRLAAQSRHSSRPTHYLEADVRCPASMGYSSERGNSTHGTAGAKPSCGRTSVITG